MFSPETSVDYPGVWFPFPHKNADSSRLDFWRFRGKMVEKTLMLSIKFTLLLHMKYHNVTLSVVLSQRDWFIEVSV